MLAHLGWSRGNGIKVPKNSISWKSELLPDVLNGFLKGDGLAYVDGGEGYDPETFEAYSIDDLDYLVLVRPDGRLLRVLEVRGVGLESADGTFYTLLGVGGIIVSLGGFFWRGQKEEFER